MTETVPVLELEALVLQPRHEGEMVPDVFSLSVGPGELVLMHFEEGLVSPTLLDTVEGLRPQASGTVRFKSTSWGDMRPDAATGYRARIGRIFPEAEAWVSNLDVMENITLGGCHHGRRPITELEEDAIAVATKLGMHGVPRTRPAWTSRADLRRAQWTRALLGEKDLLLLERPCAGMRQEDADRAIEAVQEKRSEGIAVLWITDEPGIWNKESIRPDRRFKVQGQTITEVSKQV